MKEYKLTINGNNYTVVINDVTDDAVLAEVNGKQYVVEMDNSANLPLSSGIQDVAPAIANTPSFQTSQPSTPLTAGAGDILSPIPGQIISINVTVGEKVRSGQKLLVLEAMKLENSITANADGTVKKILVTGGDVVTQGQSLIILS
jgi:biotin carboxyl carrier protein